MSTKKELEIRTRQRDWWMAERNGIIKRLLKIVSEDGKFAYGTPTRCLDVVEHVFASHRRMCNRLQEVVQKHNLGDAGMPVDEIVCAQLEKFMLFPPPIDNEFVAPGCEKFGAAVMLGKLGGSRNTRAQNAARKRNGKLGGRPKKKRPSAIPSLPI